MCICIARPYNNKNAFRCCVAHVHDVKSTLLLPEVISGIVYKYYELQFSDVFGPFRTFYVISS